jgi:cytochrome b pre-mRNA-processing protein 3
MLRMIKSWFRKDPLEEPARALYHAIVEQSRNPVFYETAGVPDTANGRFDMIVLHCFCVMQRLKQAPEGYALSQALMTVMVDDLDRNLREMGVGDLSVGKKVKRITEGFYGRLEAYGAGFESDRAALLAALRRNLYSSAENPSDGQIAMVADYLARAVARLNETGIEELHNGELRFGAPELGAAAV